MELQKEAQFAVFDDLQKEYGERSLSSIYGGGRVDHPEFCLVFMNPTARNMAANPNWRGIRAPWIGTKQVWSLLADVGWISHDRLARIQQMKPTDWTESFAADLYREVAEVGVYITNLAKCTQVDARPLSNAVYRVYLPHLMDELVAIQPKYVIAFGNQVSSLLIGRSVRVSDYFGVSGEGIRYGEEQFTVYPTFYPVGQGARNQPRAVEQLRVLRGAAPR